MVGKTSTVYGTGWASSSSLAVVWCYNNNNRFPFTRNWWRSSPRHRVQGAGADIRYADFIRRRMRVPDTLVVQVRGEVLGGYGIYNVATDKVSHDMRRYRVCACAYKRVLRSVILTTRQITERVR